LQNILGFSGELVIDIREMETALVSAAALAAGTAYLNAKLGISTDLKELALAREFTERVGKRIQGLGDTVTLYRVFELCNDGDEALWFEGRTWSYGELKTGEISLVLHGLKS
jgi:hypothetical protein